MADFRDHLDPIHEAGFEVVGISADSRRSTALLQAELFIPFDLLCDTERVVITEWDLLNAGERGGIPVPSVFAIGPGRLVQARSLDTMLRQAHPLDFLRTVRSDQSVVTRKHFMIPRLFEFLRAGRRISRDGAAD